MTLEQITLLKESFMKEVTNADGSKSTLGAYFRICLDGGIDFITSKDCILFDDDNTMLYAIGLNEDAKSQKAYPAKIMTASYEIVQQIETVMSYNNFKQFVDDNTIATDAQKEFLKKMIKGFASQNNKLMGSNSTYQPRVATVKNADGTTKDVYSIEDAIKNAKSGDSIRLYDNVMVKGEALLDLEEADSEVTLDLNGNNLTVKQPDTCPIVFNVKNGKLNLINRSNEKATIVSNGEILHVDTRKSSGNAEVIIEGDIDLISDDICVYIAGPNTKLIANGVRIENTSTGYAALQGNGNTNSAGTDIELNNCYIKTAANTGIYHPQNGKLVLNNCTVDSAKDAIYTKSGEVILNNCNVSSEGAFREYEFNGNGCNDIGAALIADFCDYPGGAPKLIINGGRYTSKNGYAIAAYDKEGNRNPEAVAGNIIIKSGSFIAGSEMVESGLADAMCAEGSIIRPGVNDRIASVVVA